ncbi:MAG: M23 family metallopeptidase [Marinilabiliaceae bacterium]|nr:M23 family metallopeptidase [Marinilabiliaceae bacterium]
MAQEKEKKKLIKKLRNRYKLVFLNEQTYEEVFMLHLSRLNAFTFFGSVALIIIALVTLLITFTPLREYIPGYPSGQERSMIIQNSQRVDSLILEINKRDKLLKNIRIIMAGGTIEGDESKTDQSDITNDEQLIDFKKSKEDSIFRLQIEQEEKFNLSVYQGKESPFQIEQSFFFCPLKGIVVGKFGESPDHFGVDIAAAQESRVSAIMDGTVIFTGWTVETGYVIQIQHVNNILSVYKHNATLLKKMGEKVQAGEVIAKVGNSGEYSTGVHLHFEIWHNGTPIDPETFIAFN